MIKITIDSEMVNKCLNFANQIIKTDNQYRRLDDPVPIRIERTFVGKLAEYSFLKYLKERGIEYQEGDMFEIFQGQSNTDGYDFLTRNKMKVDIKSASKPYHSRIMIPIDQFINTPKDYYIGIKLISRLENDKIIPISIDSAIIYGFCTYKQLEQSPTENYGTFDCKSICLQNMQPIESIIELF